MSGFEKPDVASLLSSAEWYLFNFNVRKRQFEFTLMAEEDYRESVFLDQRMKSSRQQNLQLALVNTLKLFLNAGPPCTTLSWIFHLGHCGLPSCPGRWPSPRRCSLSVSPKP